MQYLSSLSNVTWVESGGAGGAAPPGGMPPSNGQRGNEEKSRRRVSIAINPKIGVGLRAAWKRVECISVADYLQALTVATSELKRDINGAGGPMTTDFELLMAFDCAVNERRNEGSYSAAALRLLMADSKDMDATFGQVEEAEAW